jgi:hypothetical protein
MIYKYLSAKNAKLTLQSNFLKFSSPSEFNDPHDIYPGLREYGARDFWRLFDTTEKVDLLYLRMKAIQLVVDREDFDQKLPQKKFQQVFLQADLPFIEKGRLSFQAEISKYFRICCLSRQNDNILMWAHYAENFQGCVLGFDFDERPGFQKNLRSAKYKSGRIQIDPKFYYGAPYDRKVMDSIMVTKAKSWAYEDEVRLIPVKENLSTFKNKETIVWCISDCKRFLKKIVLGTRNEDLDLTRCANETSSELSIVPATAGLVRNSYQVEIFDL